MTDTDSGGYRKRTPPRTRMCPHPFFEATPPGAAPGLPVKTGARVRRLVGVIKTLHTNGQTDGRHIKGQRSTVPCPLALGNPGLVRVRVLLESQEVGSHSYQLLPVNQKNQRQIARVPAYPRSTNGAFLLIALPFLTHPWPLASAFLISEVHEHFLKHA